MNDRDTRAAILEAHTLAFVQTLDAQGGPPIYKHSRSRATTSWRA